MEVFAEITVNELRIKSRSKKKSTIFFEMKEEFIYHRLRILITNLYLNF